MDLYTVGMTPPSIFPYGGGAPFPLGAGLKVGFITFGGFEGTHPAVPWWRPYPALVTLNCVLFYRLMGDIFYLCYISFY